MIWSGALIYWANDVYRVGLGSFTLFHFFPDWFYNLTGINTAWRKAWRGTSSSCGCSP